MNLVDTILLGPILRDQIPFNGEFGTGCGTRVEGPYSATVKEVGFFHPLFYTALLCSEGT
jgi:hypothetical protein